MSKLTFKSCMPSAGLLVLVVALAWSASCSSVHAYSKQTTTTQEKNMTVFVIGVTPDAYVRPSRGFVTLGWSVLFNNINYTLELNNLVQKCYDDATGWASTKYMSYENTTTISLSIQYYGTVSDPSSDYYTENVTRFTQNLINESVLASLASCINYSDFALLQSPTQIDYGGSSLYAGGELWIIGPIIGGLIVIFLLVGGFLIHKNSKKRYKPEDYSDPAEYEKIPA
eukprot:CAMPEP_0184703200 /NCGR_PEP_ID=MMETSP0313-20130426/26985_1 /TAXON_ID=2792 /ORGANISM="Porphyridium aerugineum, Strain SAG 1380-2" /LENGTH=226 /DNA_ID=CAMNT_0027163913 /DNA_START=135 /DNA_END=815 /DNA_ORIENTATION=-